jgi:hypothetical protein
MAKTISFPSFDAFSLSGIRDERLFKTNILKSRLHLAPPTDQSGGKGQPAADVSSKVRLHQEIVPHGERG